MTTTNPPATLAGSYRVGDLDLKRIGYGAMQLAGPGVFELPLDTAGFIESRRSLAELFVRPDLAVSLQWSPLDAPPEGAPITDEVQASLTTLATNIAGRLA